VSTPLPHGGVDRRRPRSSCFDGDDFRNCMTTDPTPDASIDRPTTARRATRRDWIGLAVIALPCFVYAMDLTVLNLALPQISAELQPSGPQLLWIVDIYGFLVAGFLITMGTLGDRIGRRKLLLIGAAAFAAASVVAAFSNSAEMLIAMRALLGVAGATLAPSTLSLIRNMFHDDHERQFAIGIWIAAFSAGGAVGPLVGGVVLQFFDWGAVFLVAVPVMVLLLLLGPSLLPEYRDPDAGRVDLWSVAQSLAAVLSMIYALKRIALQGPSWQAIVLLLAGAAVAVLFVRRQSRIDYPLLDTALFRNRAFSAAISAYALTSLAMFGSYIFIVQYLQLVLALSPVQAGLAMLPWSIGFVVGSLAAPRLTRRWSRPMILAWGLVAGVVGFVGLSILDHPYPLAVLIASTVVMSLGMAPVFTVGNEMVITAAPPERAGAASALSETSAEFSGALGIAVFGSAGSAIYAHRLAAAMPPEVPAPLAAQATETLGGALAVARGLASPVGDAMLASARSAFVDALQLTAIAGAVLVALACIVSVRILRTTARG
jgi:MFS transporter, DHA2 family, multidrug resistance protein